ncbi:MAG: D-2-hydroxyacid dehydrogenase [Opitutales bacterium]|nr:D-2-hydroxyacid dehydrogenase [Opitutales bacterium]MCH8540253.1 D-2-hydroxyacid dehydrogenase [Opitutales bacterium]
MSQSPPKIVVLDGYTLNPGDLSWAALEAIGSCTFHEHTPGDQIEARSRDAEILLTNKTPLAAGVLQKCPKLRYIGVLATGYNVVDTKAAREKGVPVTNIPGYGSDSVAQHTMALLLELARGVGQHSESVRAGEWSNQIHFCYWKTPQWELTGKTIGIVGRGAIGEALARLAEAFGMKVRFITRQGGETEKMEIFAQADVLSLHCPLTPETENLINAESLGWMKKGAFLLNTSRGPLLDEAAVAEALKSGILAGAAVDVLRSEPPAPDNPLLSAPNCLITPHLAWATKEARQRLMNIAVNNIKSYLAGSPENVVNP